MEDRWQKQLQQQFEKVISTEEERLFAKQYSTILPLNYTEQHSTDEIVLDFLQIKKLSRSNPLVINFYGSSSTEHPLHIKLYRFGTPIPLSEILPMVEHMGLKTYTERPYKITLDKDRVFWISDFNVTYAQNNEVVPEILNDIFSEALLHISQGLSADDGFNKLVLSAGLSWREISVLRAYAKYMHQIGFRFNQSYLEKTLNTHALIAKKLMRLFYFKFNPKQNLDLKQKRVELEKDIQKDIDAISNLDEDHSIRYFLFLIKATLRTNYFQPDKNGQEKDYLSFKIHCSKVPELPPGQPLYEIFVYSTRFEGTHLRSAKVARGGIRWSERTEDFRTEILGLMKAQKVKNAVIVPSGAKGGFVLKHMNLPPEKLKTEIVDCYQLFIRGLLDLTDNLHDNEIIPPAYTVRYDENDPYLVVAADKGTASFSDVANGIAKEYQFWLGDAFASGGSAGYDHKKMGITARGAWESIKRHFRELDLNIEKQTFTVVGIGDMSGDVFGNGLLYSKHTRLLAAFDHRHIFLDPNPDAETSFEERLRLFQLPTSSWENYNSKLISQGGGVYPRSSKSIALSPEIKKALAIEANSLAPNELVKAILKAPVDLLYNGGIGTYVKASYEAQADVGDKTNDYCRINANELRCKVVGEGGNLGFTQLGRVEFALMGGLINTDSIDNSGGVNCSDHEVNIKIMLNGLLIKKELTEVKRNKLLSSMTEEVADLVLQDNYYQALVLSLSATNVVAYSGLYQDLIKELEKAVDLDRKVEFLPDHKKLLERKASNQGLTTPELAIIMAYTKIYITNELLKSDLPDDPYFVTVLKTGFPSLLAELYPEAMQKHRLRREIISTQLSNEIVNIVGITFMYRLKLETGQSIANIARAYTLAARSYEIDKLFKLIDSLNFKLPVQTQYEFLHYLRQLVNLATRWFLYHKRFEGDLELTISHYNQAIIQLEDAIPNLIAGITKEYLDEIVVQCAGSDAPEEILKKIAVTRSMYTLLNVIEIATQFKFDLLRSAQVYFAVGIRFNLVWFRDQIANDSKEGHWNNLSRVSLRDELDNLQRRITIAILKKDKKEFNADELISVWFTKNPFVQKRWEELLEMLMGSSHIDFSMFFITLRELSNLIMDLQI